MKYTLKELLGDENILSHFFLNCITDDIQSKIMNEERELTAQGKAHEEIILRAVDIEMKINGESVNPKAFFDMFSKQHSDLVKRQATEIVEQQLHEKFSEISKKVEEYEQLTKNWAKNIDFETGNLLNKKK